MKTIQYNEALITIKNVVTSKENIEAISNCDPHFNAFQATEIVALLFDKTKEEVIIDYLGLFKKERNL